jgi:hypothetical protein
MSEQMVTGRRGRTATPAQKTRRLGLVFALVAAAAVSVSGPAKALPPNAPKIGMVCTAGTTSAGTHTFNLVAKPGYTDTPDGNSVFMWSYANVDSPDNSHFQEPGPVLCVNQGETVVVNLANTLPEPSSIVFPGQQGVSTSGGSAGLLTREAAATSGNVTYSFTAGSPGTYLYESGSDPVKQVEMGLYGALIVRPSAGAGFAYNAASTQFDPSREYLLLLAEIDPELHHAVELGQPYNFNALLNRYFTINGREFPDTIQDNSSTLLANQPYGSLIRIQPTNLADSSSTLPAMVRMINAGVTNHPFHPHGNHTTEIAQDGRLVAPTEHFGETIGAGQTQDFLLRWDDSDQFNPVTKPFPVAQPNYRNLTFKDGTTWYAGTPYLGYKGTLPTGTVQQNLCGEWYFPMHSHALNEFTNFDQGFGGMGTLLRVDPAGGCFGFASSATLVGAVLKTGPVSSMSVSDNTAYQVKPKTTTLTSARSAVQTTMPIASAASFPTTGAYYIRVDSEVMQVTGGQGTSTWTVVRGQLGTAAASHANSATVSALATDWYAGFTGVAAGSQNLKITYEGRNCANVTGAACTALTTNVPQQTVKVCDWTIAGANGCAKATSAGWVTLAAPPAQPQSVGSANPGAAAPDLSSTWTLPGSAAHYIGTGANAGKVRVLVHTQRWTAPGPTTFATWADLFKIVYDAP